MVPTTTRVLAFSGACEECVARREREMGGRLMREVKRRRRRTLLKAESVRPVGCKVSVLLSMLGLTGW